MNSRLAHRPCSPKWATGLVARAFAFSCALFGASWGATVSNPFLWSDIPDLSIVRVGNDFYMSHTTMHLAPGVPIMKSTDLVNWKTVGYCYSTLTNSDQMNLNSGKNAYGKGSWASSIRYKDGTFHVLVPSYTTNKTHLYSTKDVEKGPWKEVQFPFYHDPSLHLDDDGRNYVVYGGGDIKIVELNADLSGVKSGGVNKTLITNPASIAGTSFNVQAEGAHIEKVGGYYYVFTITWPSGGGRTELVHRSKTLTGTYEGKIALNSQGVAQGSVIQDAKGNWWGYLFQDNGSVGRSPWIMPVTWSADWPVFNGGAAPKTLTMTTNDAAGTGIVTADNFNSTSMKLEWQWNHNPDNAKWSLSARPGHYRITSGRVDAQVVDAKNTLTQRSFGPKSVGRTVVDVANLKDGDVAGLVALQDAYGYVGVKKTGTTRSVVMVNANTQVASVEINQDRVFLRVDMDFTNKTDKATFYYSLDSTTWKAIGNTLQMSYKLTHFVGYRFGLFNYATKAAGGYADFDWFKIGASATTEIDLYPLSALGPKPLAVAARPLEFTTSPSGTGHFLSAGYELAHAGQVEILLTTPQGRVLERLAEGRQEAGTHVAGSGSSLPQGHYVLVGRIDGTTVDSRSIAVTK